jgi:hypothetical protein
MMSALPRFENSRRFTRSGTGRGREAEGGGLLNVDQPLGHLRFSSQILLFLQLFRPDDLAAVGSGGPVLASHRDNFGDSRAACACPFMPNIDNIRYDV